MTVIARRAFGCIAIAGTAAIAEAGSSGAIQAAREPPAAVLNLSLVEDSEVPEKQEIYRLLRRKGALR